MNFKSNRPQGFSGKGDEHLPQIVSELKRYLIKSQRPLMQKTLHLSNRKTMELAGVLVEFAEDVHNDIGIWKGLESYNIKFFQTPLPLILSPNENMDSNPFNELRIRYLLWVLYPELKSGLIISPTHSDLVHLSELISEFLTNAFAETPLDSGIQKFLAQSNRYGWDVKEKLLWLGQRAYLFRHIHKNYIDKRGEKPTISDIDDFVNQNCTTWSGLGVIDILSATLNISEEQRRDLRNWYERYWAIYRTLSVNDSVIESANIINNKQYVIRVGNRIDQLRAGEIVFGAIVPWNGEWYWSGEQVIYGDLAEEDIQKIKTDFTKNSPRIVYRYCDQLNKKAKETVENQYRGFLRYHGDNMVAYSDGLTMAAEMQKQCISYNKSRLKDAAPEVLKKYNLRNSTPDMSFPSELLEDETGVGVFFNPDEGIEIMMGFNDIIGAMEKKGVNLSEDEADSIRRLIMYADDISPRFIKKLVERYGDESIAEAFLIRDVTDCSYLDYLLRKYKGHFYKNRYPNISLR